MSIREKGTKLLDGLSETESWKMWKAVNDYFEGLCKQMDSEPHRPLGKYKGQQFIADGYDFDAYDPDLFDF